MDSDRIESIELDERSILRLNADIEAERASAIAALIDEGRLVRPGEEGPWRLLLAVAENRLSLTLTGRNGEPGTITLGLARFRSSVRDYFAICESYFRAARSGRPHGIEAIDMARRGLHDEAATLLRDSLAPRIAVDHETARRLFTLLCVLHIRSPGAALDSAPPPSASLLGHGSAGGMSG